MSLVRRGRQPAFKVGLTGLSDVSLEPRTEFAKVVPQAGDTRPILSERVRESRGQTADGYQMIDQRMKSRTVALRPLR
jgi:hypothetical protein